jgi:hypothetical protein
MKTIKPAAWLLAALSSVMSAVPARANTDPSSLQLTVYEMRVSENADCSSPVTVFKDDAALPVDFAANASFGAGTIPNKTYHCMMSHISDQMTVVPLATVAPDCTAGQTYVQDIFNDNLIDVSIDPGGTTVTGTPSADEKPWIYFSDAPSASAANGCYQATLSGNGGPCVLTAVNLSGDATMSLVFDFDNKIGSANASCGANSAPSLSVR